MSKRRILRVRFIDLGDASTGESPIRFMVEEHLPKPGVRFAIEAPNGDGDLFVTIVNRTAILASDTVDVAIGYLK